MKRKLYPDECVVGEFDGEHWELYTHGGLLWVNSPFGSCGWLVEPEEIKPLTPSARALLEVLSE